MAALNAEPLVSQVTSLFVAVTMQMHVTQLSHVYWRNSSEVFCVEMVVNTVEKSSTVSITHRDKQLLYPPILKVLSDKSNNIMWNSGGAVIFVCMCVCVSACVCVPL